MTSITAILGVQGKGKTMLMTYYGTREHDRGRRIFSNYHLEKIDYIPVSTLNDLEHMRNGVFLGDELWLWLFSRTAQSRINKEINKIVMLNRKRDVDIYYTAQRFGSVDIMLRSVTNLFVFPSIKKDTNDNWRLYYRIYDEIGRYIKTLYIKKSIEELGSYYDTTEEISSLDKETPLEKGIRLESKFSEALQKLDFDAVDLIPNSGSNSSWNYDVTAVKTGKWFCFDVKGVAKGRVLLKTHGNALKRQIKNAYIHKARPYLAFPEYGRKQLTNPKFWYIYPLTYNSYLVSLSSYPSYDKLVSESLPLETIFQENNPFPHMKNELMNNNTPLSIPP
jgi:Holliday junction resolvase - archaeal type